jgi:hypothetical protein
MTVNNNSEKECQKSGSGSFSNEQKKLTAKGLVYKSRKNMDMLAKKASL